jgi:hypothetical protein
MQARPSAGRCLMDIHLITRPIVPELRAVAVCSLVYAGPDAFG